MKKNLSEYYVCSCEKDGGAYQFTLTDDEQLIIGKKIPVSNPMWSEIINGKLCVCFFGENWIYNGVGESTEGYAEFSLSDGSKIGDIIPSGGSEVCHFCKYDSTIYIANYGDGSLVMAKDGKIVRRIEHKPSASIPCGCHPTRQDHAYVHQCILSPDKKYLLVCDLGLDCVFVYDHDLNVISHAKTPDGHGARHSIFSKDGKTVYTLSEMGASVTEFSWDDGYLLSKNTVSIRKNEQVTTAEGAAAIRLSEDGKHLYCTDRGENTISHLTTSGGLKLISQTPCGGEHPRDFTLIANGKYGVCCNRFSNNIALFRILDNAEPEFVQSYDIPSPVCASEV